MDKQKEALELTKDLWNKFLEIPKFENHNDDVNDVRFNIHAIQNILYTQLYKKRERVEAKNEAMKNAFEGVREALKYGLTKDCANCKYVYNGLLYYKVEYCDNCKTLNQ